MFNKVTRLRSGVVCYFLKKEQMRIELLKYITVDDKVILFRFGKEKNMWSLHNLSQFRALKSFQIIGSYSSFISLKKQYIILYKKYQV